MMERHTKRAQGIAVKILGAVVSMLAIAAVIPMFFGSIAGVASEVSDIVTYTGPGETIPACVGGDDDDLTVVGSPVAVSDGGVWGSGFSYPSDDSDYHLDDGAVAYSADDALSVMVAFRTDNAGQMTLLSYSGTSEVNFGITKASSSRMGVLAGDAEALDFDQPATGDDGDVHVYLFTRSAGYAYASYVDGSNYTASGLTPDVVSDGASFRIAGPVVEGSRTGFTGSIYEVRVWDRELTESEALSLTDPGSSWPAFTGDEVAVYCMGVEDVEVEDADVLYDPSVVSFITFLPLLVGFTGLMALVGLILATVQLRR